MNSDDIERLTAPQHFERLVAVERVSQGRRTDHRCGRCANPFTGGSDDCPNFRASQSIPYIGPDDDPGPKEVA